MIDNFKKLCKIVSSTGNVTGNVSRNKLTHMNYHRRRKNPVKIQDVAAAAGVSVSTVSRVLNNKDDVSLETFERVNEVIDNLGYTSSLAARSMRSHKTNVIGLIMPDAGEPFPIEVMKGVNSAIAALDYDLLIYTCGDYRKHFAANREKKYVSLLNNSITDGVIVITPVSKHFTNNAPVVAVDPHFGSTEYPAVISTNKEGVIEAMNYLFELGHRRIGFISGRSDLKSAERRLRGYQDSLAKAGIPLNPDLIAHGDYSAEAGLRCARQLLNLPLPPTAIFAGNDQSALGVYQAAQEAGLSIPGDLSIIGFDNIPDAALVNPGLTTIDQFIREMGKIATEMLVKLIEGETLENKVVKTTTHLVIRESCQALDG
jgi:LacI family transcriptional regulator